MRTRSIYTALAILPALAACGGNGGTDFAASKYSPVYTDGLSVVYDALVGPGLTGFAGGTDGKVVEIRVRVDDSGLDPILYVSVDGGPEVEYDEIDFATYDDFEGWMELFNAAGEWAYIEYFGTNAAYVEFGDSDMMYREGAFGLETASASMPTGKATYYGGWDAYGQTETTMIEAGGYMALAVDFDDGALQGITEGGFGAWDSGLEESTSGALLGTIDGDISGSRVQGTMTLFGDATGSMDLKGAFYGEAAEELAGGVGGSLNTDLGEMDLGGGFWTGVDYLD